MKMTDILIWLAILPSAVLIGRVLRLDKVEGEPIGLLVRTFLLGCLTCFPAAFLESIGDNLLMGLVSTRLGYSLGMYLVVVPLAEEGLKYLAMRNVRKNPAFNYTFDGIVYGVMASLGFATLENLFYVLGLFDVGVAVARAFLSVPLHCVCGVFMGYYYGIAHRHKALGNQSQARANSVLALLVPMIIHGLYDFSLDTEDSLITLAGFAFTVVMFLLAINRVRTSSRNDEAFWGGYQPVVAPMMSPTAAPVAPSVAASVAPTAVQQPQQEWQPVPDEWQSQQPAAPIDDQSRSFNNKW